MRAVSAGTGRPILFYSTMDGNPWGGSEELWFEAAMGMAQAGCSVAASVRKWPNPAGQLAQLRSRNVTVHERAVPAAPLRALHLIYPAARLGWLRAIRPRFAVISQGANWEIETIEIAENLIRLDIPYVIISQCAYPWYWPSDDAALRMRNAFRNAQSSYFVSKANLALTELQVGAAIPNGKVVWNPFRVDYSQPIPWPEEDTLRLACVGRLEPGFKGQDLLLEALSAPLWRERKLHVTFYGAGGNAEIVRAIHARWQLPHVSFGGFMEPSEIWRHNHALILASRAEGLPITVVEAMLCGRPCIVTGVGGNPEVLDEGITGFLANEVTAAGIGNALERAWQRKDEWKSMGQRGAVRIRELCPSNPAAALVEHLAGLMASCGIACPLPACCSGECDGTPVLELRKG
jgi:glycosyltransferase involved in cell wall biosynthesis